MLENAGFKILGFWFFKNPKSQTLGFLVFVKSKNEKNSYSFFQLLLFADSRTHMLQEYREGLLGVDMPDIII